MSSPGSPAVSFYLPDEDLLEVAALDPDKAWAYFGGPRITPRCWIAQTYLRLRARGRPVDLVNRAPSSGTVVYFQPERHSLLPQLRGRRVLQVAVRADAGPAYQADFEIVQNSNQSKGIRRVHVPHWPQPGLLERDRRRGSTIRNIAFMGNPECLGGAFDSPGWKNFLEQEGIRWQSGRAAESGRACGPQASSNISWNDYTEVDIMLAVRGDTTQRYVNKPASKLINAWRAGVPALLGPEVAYRELRRSELDYVEVSSVDNAILAVRSLISDPVRYKAIVENGRSRAREFSFDAVADCWDRLLFQTIPEKGPVGAGTAYRSLRLAARSLRDLSHGGYGFRQKLRDARAAIRRWRDSERVSGKVAG